MREQLPSRTHRRRHLDLSVLGPGPVTQQPNEAPAVVADRDGDAVSIDAEL
jgi:hypothetical protein